MKICFSPNDGAECEVDETYVRDQSSKPYDPNSDRQVGGKITKEERIQYLELVNQITSRDPTLDYSDITSKLMDYLKKDALQKIADLHNAAPTISSTLQLLRSVNDSRSSKEEKMKSDLEYIFSKIDHSDNNYIGRLNIVSLQIVILFTENCHPPGTVFKVNFNNEYEEYQNLKEGDWKSYVVMRDNLMKDKYSKFIKMGSSDINNTFKVLYSYPIGNPYTTSVPPDNLIYLITILDYLSIDEINTSFLNKTIICGIVNNYVYADGRYLTPFEFLQHDITHGESYEGLCYERIDNSRKDFISFYNFCKGNIDDKKRLYSIKFMFFLLIHESWCDFFPTRYNPNITKQDVLSSVLDNQFLHMDRFLNTNDLELSLPKDYRGSKEKIDEYLALCADIYLEELNKWKEPKKFLPGENPYKRRRLIGGGKKSRRKYKKNNIFKGLNEKKCKRKFSHKRK